MYSNSNFNKNTQWRNNPNPQQISTGPNPQRFSSFQLLHDETGFTIPNCSHVFYFDTHGGWFDEFENYYNADGEPCTPPSYDDDDDYNPADKWANEYDDGEDDEEGDDFNYYDKVFLNAENRRVLATYLKDENINVEIRNMNFKITEDDFEKFLINKKIEWIEFEFEYDDKNRFRGICYVVLDKENAEKLIEFNGSKVFDREFKVFVQKKESDEDVEDIHEIGAGVILNEKVSKEEEKVPEKPREKIFQRNQVTEPSKKIVYVGDLEQNLNKDKSSPEKIAPQVNEQKAQTQVTTNKPQTTEVKKKDEEVKTAEPAQNESPSKGGWGVLPKFNKKPQGAQK